MECRSERNFPFGHHTHRDVEDAAEERAGSVRELGEEATKFGVGVLV